MSTPKSIKHNKTVKSCPLCVKTSECRSCQGICMFSKDFKQKRLDHNRHLKESFSSKYFPLEFCLLKKYINLPEERPHELCDYLANFHSLGIREKTEILELHTGNQNAFVSSKSIFRQMAAKSHLCGVYHHNHDHYLNKEKPVCNSHSKYVSSKAYEVDEDLEEDEEEDFDYEGLENYIYYEENSDDEFGSESVDEIN